MNMRKDAGNEHLLISYLVALIKRNYLMLNIIEKI
jgi:hypothetical protein